MPWPPVFGKVFMLPLEDGFSRRFYYLRLSVTDVCNFRCTYCLPDGYHPPKGDGEGRQSFLSLGRSVASSPGLRPWGRARCV